MKKTEAEAAGPLDDREVDSMLAMTRATIFESSPQRAPVGERLQKVLRITRAIPPDITGGLLVMLPPTASDSPRLYRLPKKITVGRGAQATLKIEDPAKKLSSLHFEIRESGSGHLLVDEGSKNGTRINEHRIPTVSHPLSDGDFIHAGGFTFAYLLRS